MSWFMGGHFQNLKDSKIFKRLKDMSSISNKVNLKLNKLNNVEFKDMLDRKKYFYISLKDLIKVIDKSKNTELNIEDFKKFFKHGSEINPNNCSYIDVHAIPDDNGHIVLCPNKDSCEEHKEYVGDKIRITTIKIK